MTAFLCRFIHKLKNVRKQIENICTVSYNDEKKYTFVKLYNTDGCLVLHPFHIR